MSQEKKSLTYKVKLSYYTRDIDEDGIPTVRLVKDAEVEVLHLQRLNKAHADLALKILTNAVDRIEAAPEFVKCTVIDDKVREAILEDALACFHLANSPEAQKDLESFFGNWDFLKNPATRAAGKE